MIYTLKYLSPIGEIRLLSRDGFLIELHISGYTNYHKIFNEKIVKKQNYFMLIQTKERLNSYFRGEKPGTKYLNMNLIGTEFQKLVRKILETIQYGETMTYGKIAYQIVR